MHSNNEQYRRSNKDKINFSAHHISDIDDPAQQFARVSIPRGREPHALKRLIH